MFRLPALCLLLVTFIMGCNRPNTPTNPPNAPNTTEDKGRVNVNAPGVNVDVQGKGTSDGGRVKVNAPGVDVDVSRKQ